VRKTIRFSLLSLFVAAAAVAGCEELPPPGEGEGEGEGVPGVEAPVPASRLPRLSHAQWERSVRDLLGLPADTDYAAALRSDPNPGGAKFEEHGTLRVDQSLWQGYQRAAEQVAADVTADDALVLALAPADDDEQARVDAFVRTQGQRAHRRPLSEDEVTAYKALFATGADGYADVPPPEAFVAGVRIVIEAWLQSPFFLYRPELVATEEGGVVALDDWEVASRLSYALWGTMPDADLFAAAERGELRTADQVEAAARRMLDDPRATAVVEDFHHRLFDVERYPFVQPPGSLGVSAGFGDALVQEHHLFVADVFDTEGGLFELLTSTRTFVNDELAGIYELEGQFGPDFVPVDLDAQRRRGLLTMAGFLAKNASGGQPDPIHRGVFVSTQLACNEVPAPPDDIPPFPNVEGQTNRSAVEELTEAEGTVCAGCHTETINPYGFPFENYDAVGRYRTEDNGFDVDASSVFRLGLDEHAVNDGLGLVDALAASDVVHKCYAGHLVRFLYGRPLDREVDEPLLARVGAASVDRGSLKELIVALTRSVSFRTRSAEELP
jgi:mono/diheme cytochrome c family protein